MEQTEGKVSAPIKESAEEFDKLYQEVRDSIGRMGIGDLRIVARGVGVRAPTKLKSGQVKEEIFAIAEKRSEPYVELADKSDLTFQIKRMKKRGQPIKATESPVVEECIAKVKLLYALKSYNAPVRKIRYSDSGLQYGEIKPEIPGVKTISGIAVVRGGSASLWDLDAPAPVKCPLDAKACGDIGLKSGMLVTGRALLGINGRPIKVSIREIEGVPLEKYISLPDFGTIHEVNAFRRLQLGRTTAEAAIADFAAPVRVGGRMLVKGNAASGKSHFIKRLIDSLKVSNPKMQFCIVLPQCTKEDAALFGKAYCASGAPTENDTAAGAEVVHASIERAKRFAECGENTVLVVDSISKLAKLYNREYVLRHRDASLKLLNEEIYRDILSIFGSARDLENGGSLTVIASADTGTGEVDDVLCDELTHLATAVITMDSALKRAGKFPSVDITKSFSRGEEGFVDAAHMQQLIADRGTVDYTDAEKAWEGARSLLGV